MGKTDNKKILSILKEEERFTKEEMNLVEYPFTLLSRRAPKGIKTIEYTDWITVDGKKKPLKWIITGSDKYGLPVGGDQDIYIAINEVWKESGYKDKVIPIGSIYQMLKRLGMPDGKQYYLRFKQCLDRFIGTTFYAENAFWDKEHNCYISKRAFHIFEDYHLLERYKKDDATIPLPLGYIRASEFFYQSVKAGYLKDVDLHFYLSLPNPLTRRLYRYLDKKRYHGMTFSMELYKFAGKIGLLTSSREKYFPSKLKQILNPALDELREKLFLKSYSYQKTADQKNTKIVFLFKEGLSKKAYRTSKEDAKDGYEIECLAEDILAVCQDKGSIEFYKKVARLLPPNTVYRAISEVKEVRDLGVIKKSKGALFTSLIKKYAAEQGIKL